eukprot:jgi/Botrbrau1/14148/Bobra.182_3s0089.1
MRRYYKKRTHPNLLRVRERYFRAPSSGVDGKPDWDDTLHDLSAMRLTPEQLVKRKTALKSKNSICISGSLESLLSGAQVGSHMGSEANASPLDGMKQDMLFCTAPLSNLQAEQPQIRPQQALEVPSGPPGVPGQATKKSTADPAARQIARLLASRLQSIDPASVPQVPLVPLTHSKSHPRPSISTSACIGTVSGRLGQPNQALQNAVPIHRSPRAPLGSPSRSPVPCGASGAPPALRSTFQAAEGGGSPGPCNSAHMGSACTAGSTRCQPVSALVEGHEPDNPHAPPDGVDWSMGPSHWLQSPACGQLASEEEPALAGFGPPIGDPWPEQATSPNLAHGVDSDGMPPLRDAPGPERQRCHALPRQDQRAGALHQDQQVSAPNQDQQDARHLYGHPTAGMPQVVNDVACVIHASGQALENSSCYFPPQSTGGDSSSPRGVECGGTGSGRDLARGEWEDNGAKPGQQAVAEEVGPHGEDLRERMEELEREVRGLRADRQAMEGFVRTLAEELRRWMERVDGCFAELEARLEGEARREALLQAMQARLSNLEKNQTSAEEARTLQQEASEKVTTMQLLLNRLLTQSPASVPPRSTMQYSQGEVPLTHASASFPPTIRGQVEPPGMRPSAVAGPAGGTEQYAAGTQLAAMAQAINRDQEPLMALPGRDDQLCKHASASLRNSPVELQLLVPQEGPGPLGAVARPRSLEGGPQAGIRQRGAPQGIRSKARQDPVSQEGFPRQNSVHTVETWGTRSDDTSQHPGISPLRKAQGTVAPAALPHGGHVHHVELFSKPNFLRAVPVLGNQPEENPRQTAPLPIVRGPLRNGLSGTATRGKQHQGLPVVAAGPAVQVRSPGRGQIRQLTMPARPLPAQGLQGAPAGAGMHESPPPGTAACPIRHHQGSGHDAVQARPCRTAQSLIAEDSRVDALRDEPPPVGDWEMCLPGVSHTVTGGPITLNAGREEAFQPGSSLEAQRLPEACATLKNDTNKATDLRGSNLSPCAQPSAFPGGGTTVATEGGGQLGPKLVVYGGPTREPHPQGSPMRRDNQVGIGRARGVSGGKENAARPAEQPNGRFGADGAIGKRRISKSTGSASMEKEPSVSAIHEKHVTVITTRKPHPAALPASS